MSKPKRVTIYDVAREAKVSPSTVSRAFSNPGRVSADTSAHIFDVARKLGFHTVGASYSDQREENRTLAFVLADLSNPVYASMLAGFQSTATKNNYSVIILNSQENEALERRSVMHILDTVDGIALAASRLSPASILKIEKTRPLVLLHRYSEGHTCVVPDTSHGIGQICEHLASLGHRKLTYLSGPELSWANAMRWRAAQAKTVEAGITLIRTQNYTPDFDGGQRAADEWFTNPTSAVLAYNDLMACGFMKAAANKGFNIPRDVSVIGIDNSITCTIAEPELSSLSSGSYEIGEQAALSLIWQADNRSRRDRRVITVPTDFVQRQSTGPRAQVPLESRML
ncbi:LacI family DNA-binding transcriptional regulator [Arcanobacterium bovis]|uniref:LacI family transcriptional regulator n=1 Tax=Arcanobacterium bovis TaxID=2529275 RepID=A0A4Q9UZB4_9ACTO|nr:LacI family DNA-binding transcriptional regulator [Arcanobacterium bovis]TBW21094.1 LacI family transcriptional regulator [Arcanobacterium bovis]